MLTLILIGALSGFINGFFASGGGVILVLFLERFGDMEKKKAHATTIVAILVFSLISLFIYTKNGHIDMKTAIPISIAGAIGGFLGAKLLKKLPNKYIGKIFGALMIISAVRMLW